MADGTHMSLRETGAALRADWRRNRGNPKGRFVVSGFRCAGYFATRKSSAPMLWVLGLPAMVCYRLCVEWGLGIEIPAKTRVGPGLQVWHGQGLVVHPRTVIGAEAVLRHCTTIGVKSAEVGNSDAPVLGDGVDVGSNAVILGPVAIGDHAVIGAGAVVTHDVAPGQVVAGNPAAVIVRSEGERTTS